MNAMIEPEEYDSLPEITKRIGKIYRGTKCASEFQKH